MSHLFNVSLIVCCYIGGILRGDTSNRCAEDDHHCNSFGGRDVLPGLYQHGYMVYRYIH